MSKRIFNKFFIAMMSVVTVSFVVLGVAVSASTAQSLGEQRRDQMMTNALATADMVAKVMEYEQLGDGNVLHNTLLVIPHALNADIIITDRSAQVIQYSLIHEDVLASLENSSAIPADINNQALSGRYFRYGSLGGLYTRKDIYAVGVPITLASGDVVGAVFLASPMDSVFKLIGNNLRMFLISGIFVILLAYAISYFVTKKLTKPLSAISNSVREIGRGNFAVRAPVTSDDEIGELAQTFNAMADSLASVESMRRSFVTNVSHELKTPMTTIDGFVEGILDGTIPPDKHEYYLKIVSTETKRLARLVRSMLDLSRIEAGQFVLKPVTFDMVDVIGNVLIAMEGKISEKCLDIRGISEQSVMVEADKDIIHQVVFNLIDNAVKFSNPGGYIEINLSEKNGMVYCGIKNSGMGIPREDMPKIFERFYKTDRSRSRDRDGVGLGLYIVKTMVNFHHGEITVSSMEGEYCQFTFSIPVKAKEDR